MLAYSVDVAGDEVYRLAFRDLETGKDLPDAVAHTYYGGAWSSDSSTFVYVVHDDVYRPFQVWRHVLGTPGTDDVCVFQEDDEKFDVMVWADRAGRFIVIDSSNRDTSEEWLLSATDPTRPATIVSPRRPHIEYTVAHLPDRTNSDDGRLLVVTNDGATEFHLAHCPVSEPDSAHWQPVSVSKEGERLHSVDVFANHCVFSLVSEGRQLLRVVPTRDLLDVPLKNSHDVHAVAKGGLLTLWHNEEFDVDRVLIEEESYVSPLTWYEVDLASGQRRLVRSQKVPTYSEQDYVLEEKWVSARDGERIPIKLVRHRETPLDGTAPLLLYGYGAYESAFWPGFEPSLASLLDRGVVFVHAGIRGGGYCGRRWWLGGRLKTKMNTFTDFIDVADNLASERVIDGDRIVSRGLSAGGLLQGAVYSMRPDRWHAVVAEVPFVDVVTTMSDHSFPLSATEVDEWGDPRQRDDFEYMLGYSPIDNVPTERRPLLLATGALHDPRVMVHEPAKWVAKLRASATAQDADVLFRVETGEGGHVGPTGRYAHLEYEAEVAAFILNAVGKAS
jgi:oligopeptidase B